MTLLKYLLFQAWELPRVPFWSTGHLDNTYDTDSDLCQGKCLYIPLSVEVCSSWFSFIPWFVYAGVQSVLTRIFQMRISRIVPNIARKTCVCSVVKGEALCGAYACHACFTVNTNNHGSPCRFFRF